jgi:uncharacterized protein DUF2188
MKKNVWVSHRDDGSWAVKKEGNQKASALCDTQAEAIEIARQQAKNEKSELIVQGRNGQIRQKDSFGNDPCPPKDKK